MDEQNMNNTMPEPATPQESQPVSQPVSVPEASTPMQPPTQPLTQTQGIAYASFFERLVAALIDGVLIAVVTGILASLLGISGEGGSSMFSNPLAILGWVYAIFMVVKYGATLGKMVMGLRVQQEVTGANLTWVEAFLREVVGKLISSIVILLGYFWMLWDPKKQTWHDKIAKSVVVKVRK
ncbi:MAG TPA: RDD family protein [Patescibacteria group bacterium]|nr:RDD family protein [Patescibacteria group bacterium]